MNGRTGIQYPEQLTITWRLLYSRCVSLDVHEVVRDADLSFDPYKSFKITPEEAHSVAVSHSKKKEITNP